MISNPMSKASKFCLKLVAGAVSAMLAFSIAGTGQAEDLKSLTLQLDWLPTGYHAPIFLSLQKGY